MPFDIGDKVIHQASGEKGVVVSIRGASGLYAVSYGFKRICDCPEEALELDQEEN